MKIESLSKAVAGISLGDCPKCMQKSFRAATIAWFVLMIATRFIGEALVLQSIGILAIVLTLVWVAHLIAFSYRRVAGGAVAKRELASGVACQTRRAALSMVAKTVAGGLALTILPTLSGAADRCPSCCTNNCKDCSKCNPKLTQSESESKQP